MDLTRSLNIQWFGPEQAQSYVICVHGGPGMDSSYFWPFLKDLSVLFKVVLFDSGKQDPASVETLINELNLVIDACPASAEVVLLGHSFGGVLTLEAVDKRNGSRVKSVVLVSWIHDTSWVQDFRKMNPRHQNPAPEVLERAKSRLEAITMDAASLYFPQSSLEEGKKALSKVRYNDNVWDDLQGYMKVVDCKPILSNLNLPVLSIAGESDRVVSLDHVRRGMRLVKNGVSRELVGCGHFPFIDAPGVFCREVASFITGT